MYIYTYIYMYIYIYIERERYIHINTARGRHATCDASKEGRPIYVGANRKYLYYQEPSNKDNDMIITTININNDYYH